MTTNWKEITRKVSDRINNGITKLLVVKQAATTATVTKKKISIRE